MQNVQHAMPTTVVVRLLQINEALNDNPQEGLIDFSMRNEVDQILSVGKRIAACMAK